MGERQQRECLIVGQANVGKTLFLLQFARSLGMRIFELVQEWPAVPGGSAVPGRPVGRQTLTLEPDEAVRSLVGPAPHLTRQAQSVVIRLPAGKGYRTVRLTDTSGLSDDVHPESEVRQGMVQTLDRIRSGSVVLHLIDAALAGQQAAGVEASGPAPAIGRIDLLIRDYAGQRAAYAVLANKMDLPWAPTGLERIQTAFRGRLVIPVSALDRRGFRQVRGFLARYA